MDQLTTVLIIKYLLRNNLSQSCTKIIVIGTKYQKNTLSATLLYIYVAKKKKKGKMLANHRFDLTFLYMLSLSL